MGCVLGCIADDFTGATDLAGLLARSGVPVSLRIGIPDTKPDDAAAIEVIALKCRTAPVGEAVSECLRALEWLEAAGARRFFWKYCSTFDSTAEGNIGPVAEALMNALSVEQTIYCPAFPENGRSIFMGHLFVGREPLAESPMKDHPLTPMRDSNLVRLLEPQTTRPVGLIDRLTVARGVDAMKEALARHRLDGVAHVVVDAVADEDLTTIAKTCVDFGLMTGGSAVTMALPGLYRQQGLIPPGDSKPASRPTDPAAIVLSGSCSAMTRAQVAHFLAQGGPSHKLDPLSLHGNGHEAVLDWLQTIPLETTPLIYATAEPDEVKQAQSQLGVAEAGAVVEDALAAVAAKALERGVRRFVVAGGETSGAVTKALEVQRLDIGLEIAPGVPWTYCQSGRADIALALKSGNFGAVDFFAEALAKLESS